MCDKGKKVSGDFHFLSFRNQKPGAGLILHLYLLILVVCFMRFQSFAENISHFSGGGGVFCLKLCFIKRYSGCRCLQLNLGKNHNSLETIQINKYRVCVRCCSQIYLHTGCKTLNVITVKIAVGRVHPSISTQ